MSLTNMQVIIPLQPIASSFQSPTTSLAASPRSNFFPEEDRKKSVEHNAQTQYALLEQGNFPNTSDRNISGITVIDSILSEHFSEANTRTIQLDQTTTSTNINQNVTDNSNPDNYVSLFDELMDVLHSTGDAAGSTYKPANGNADLTTTSILSSNKHTTVSEQQNHARKKPAFNQRTNNYKTLFVSGLRSDVNANNIRSHFTGCIKVTIKSYNTAPYLKYAFVVHRSSREAEHNLRRSINFHLLGSDCRVEYANNSSTRSSDHPNVDNKKLMIGQIPKNTSENHLRRLFVDCRILKYCPAQPICFPAMSTKMKNKSKISLGYAFILYDNEEQAAAVIEHADQYHINGQPLAISIYRNKRSSHITT